MDDGRSINIAKWTVPPEKITVADELEADAMTASLSMLQINIS